MLTTSFLELVNGEKQKIEVGTDNYLDDATLDELHVLLRDTTLKLYANNIQIDLSVDEIEPEGGWTYRHNGTKLTKRLMAIIKRVLKETNQQVTTSQLTSLIDFQKIGELIYSNKVMQTSCYFDVVDRFNWSAGDFGEKKGSCFWNGRTDIRQFMAELGIKAIRLFDQKEVKGFGRCWAYPVVEEDALVLFNFYGYNGDVFAEAIAKYFQVPYKEVKAYNNDEWDGILYINRGIAFTLNKTDSPYWDFQINMSDWRYCHDCRRYYYTEYCPRCYNE